MGSHLIGAVKIFTSTFPGKDGFGEMTLPSHLRGKEAAQLSPIPSLPVDNPSVVGLSRTHALPGLYMLLGRRHFTDENLNVNIEQHIH